MSDRDYPDGFEERPYEDDEEDFALTRQLHDENDILKGKVIELEDERDELKEDVVLCRATIRQLEFELNAVRNHLEECKKKWADTKDINEP